MKKHIVTLIRLRYVTDGNVELPPENIAELVSLDEDAHSVADGYMTVDEIFLNGFSCTSRDSGSVADVEFSVHSTYDGPPEDFDKALSDGWLVWDCETADDGPESHVWTLDETLFENSVADAVKKRFDLN